MKQSRTKRPPIRLDRRIRFKTLRRSFRAAEAMRLRALAEDRAWRQAVARDLMRRGCPEHEAIRLTATAERGAFIRFSPRELRP